MYPRGNFMVTEMPVKQNRNKGQADGVRPAIGTEVPRWKRILDVALVLLALPLLVPIMLVIAVIIWVVSDGPILFRQERVGHRGRRFMCFKFRTMHANNDTSVHQGHLQQLMSSDQPMTKMDVKGDPRIIPFG